MAHLKHLSSGLDRISSLLVALKLFLHKDSGREYTGVCVLSSKVNKEIHKAKIWVERIEKENKNLEKLKNVIVQSADRRDEFLYKEAELKKRNESFKHTVQHDEELINKLYLKIRNLQETLCSKDVEFDENKTELQRLKKESISQQLKIKRLEQELQLCHDKLFRHGNEIERRDVYIADLNEQEMKLLEMEKQSHKLKGILSENDELKRTIQISKRNIYAFEKDVKTIKEKTDCNESRLLKKDENITLLEKNLKEKDSELHQAEKNKETEMRGHIRSLEVTVTRLASKIEEKEQNFRRIEEIFSEQNTDLNLLQRDIEIRDLRIKALEKKLLGKTNTEKDERSEYKWYTENKLAELKDELQRALSKLQNTETELDETKTRLSKAIGERSTDNKPNMTELSYINRPTKLAERYTELYDNQWTDAFDILDKHFNTEKDVINALLQMLQDIYSFCNNTADEQMTRIASELALQGDSDASADVHIPNQLKDCRKMIANVAVGNLYQMYVAHRKKSTDEIFRTAALELIPYSKECLEICWFMVIQDPPVVFAPLLPQGSRFDTELYKPYTSSGTHIEYVIWPPLLLHEGGPMLTKGVAQGNGKKSQKSS